MSSPGISRFLNPFKRTPPAVRADDDDWPTKPAPETMHQNVSRVTALHFLDDDEQDDPKTIVPSTALAGVPAVDEAPSAAVVAFVEQVKQLPLFTSTAMQLMKSVDDEDASADDLARLISCDVGLVAQLLRIVNSPYYGLPKPCATVMAAISVLGLDAVRRGVMASITQRPLMAYLHDTKAVQAFWRHQMLCAAIARHIAVQQGLDGEAAYMAGLMHEIGRLVILIKHPHLTDALLGVERDDDHFTAEDERAHFGFDHAEIGAALLARWGMPPAIVKAVDDHEQESRPADPMSAAVWRANQIVHIIQEEPEDIDAPLPWMIEIDLSIENRRRIFDEIAALGGGQG